MSELSDSIRRHRQSIFALGMVVLVVWLLWTVKGALPAFFIGVALAFVLDPIVTFLARQGAPRWAGVIVAYVGVVLAVWAVIAFAVPPIARQTTEFIAHLPELGASVGDIERALMEWYAGLPLPDELRAADRRAGRRERTGVRRHPARPARSDAHRGAPRRDVHLRARRHPGLALLRAQGS